MAKRKFKSPERIDWKLVTACRKKGETWKEISARIGMSHHSLRNRASQLGKTELLGGRRGRRFKADWSLIAKLYKQGKPLGLIAARVGLTSGHSLSANLSVRRKDGRWKLPKMRQKRPATS
ncbi:MAG TPA: hypothetical protein VK717_01630 [Opitutaceae bacterium]|jgi:hypothetical protein|nr:hypothetical protein [Opitutaceae bacterium]